MMPNRNFWLVVAAALLLLIGVFVWLGQLGDRPKFDWQESTWGKKAYSEMNDQPYGTQVFRQLLDGYFEGQTLTTLSTNVQSSLPIDSSGSVQATYVFVGEGLYLDSLDTEHLKHFVSKGHTALIVSKTIPFDLMSYIYFQECDYDLGWDDYQQHDDSTVTASLLAYPKPDGQPTTAPLRYAVQNQQRPYRWSYLPDHVFCPELPQRALGELNDTMVNFARFPFGKGSFLLHTTPIAFSNYQLTQATTRPYVEGVLAHLPRGPVYWDAFSRVPEEVARRRNDPQHRDPFSEQHALSFILTQEPLAWAWYLLVGLALLYVVFRARRRQRIVPVLAPNENSSREFIKTIAHLHFRERNHHGISVQAMRLHLAQIRERYGLVSSLDPRSDLPKADDAYFRRLASVSEVPEQDIRKVFHDFADIARFSATEQQMIDFHQSLERFWRVAK
jgi:hypothetical protein